MTKPMISVKAQYDMKLKLLWFIFCARRVEARGARTKADGEDLNNDDFVDNDWMRGR
jgi:hypothetical protein